MTRTLHYLFDPLCGWCYGASPAIADVIGNPSLQLVLMPTGLFAGSGARPMDDAFSAFAWSNDLRIEHMTGQRFSEAYHRKVLADRQQRFDSGPATLALTAVAVTAPERELEALQAIQRARYVDGRDVTRAESLAGLLRDLGLQRAAALLTESPEPLLEAASSRIERARKLMLEVGAEGVPTFVLEAAGQRRLVRVGSLFSSPRSLARQVQAD